MKTNDKSMLHFDRVRNDVPRHLIVTPNCNLAANTLADNFRRPPYCASCDLRRRLSSYHLIKPDFSKLGCFMAEGYEKGTRSYNHGHCDIQRTSRFG